MALKKIENGIEMDMTPEEESEIFAIWNKTDAEKPIADIIREIQILESSITKRALREAALGIGDGRVAAVDSKISALRNQLEQLRKQ